MILGGGPAGLATAIATASQIKGNILLVEQYDFAHQRVGENIPPETLILLKKLGLGEAFRQSGHQVCPSFASVWGKNDVGFNDFIVNPLGHSWRLNRRAFDNALAHRAKALGVQFMLNTRFVQALGADDGYQVELKDKITDNSILVKARFVVDATGSAALFAKSLGVKKQVDDKLVATVRFANVGAQHKGKQVLIEATKDSWCYHALLPEQKVVSMVVTEQELSLQLKQENYQCFEQHLANTLFISEKLQKLTLSACHYHTYPITSGVLPTLEGNNWIAVGDAAASFDPIAAQGIYKGLHHGVLAAQKVAAWFNSQDITLNFSQKVTEHYQHYLQNRAHMYGLEKRFVNEGFWRRRVD